MYKVSAMYHSRNILTMYKVTAMYHRGKFNTVYANRQYLDKHQRVHEGRPQYKDSARETL